MKITVKGIKKAISDTNENIWGTYKDDRRIYSRGKMKHSLEDISQELGDEGKERPVQRERGNRTSGS